MKKIMTGVVLAVCLTSSSFAAVSVLGTVTKIQFTATAVSISVTRSSDQQVIRRNLDNTLSSTYRQELIASILTAYSTKSEVVMSGVSSDFDSMVLR